MAATNLRRDVEGLRGFAIALVVLFHVFVGRVSSGVDVFLLLGGVFFFSSQLNNARNPRGLTCIQSFLRIFRRLFPLLAVVVGTTLAIGLATLSSLERVPLAQDAAASLTYTINWQLALSGREYTNAQNPVSPFQHLWSMSAQMQIYVASLLVVVLLARIFKRRALRAMTVLLTLGVIASFAYASVMVQQDQLMNYFSSLSRFWEVGLGGLVGLVILPRKDADGKRLPPLMRDLPPLPRRVLGWAGLAAIICTGWFVDGAHEFPGPWTLVPLVGAVCVLLAGQGNSPVGVTRLLITRPLQELGTISYALYLWHWPLLILAEGWYLWDRQPVLGSFTVIIASLVLAWASNRLVERPLRQTKRPPRSHVVFDKAYLRSSLRAWPKVLYSAVIAAVAVAVIAAPDVVMRNQGAEQEQLWQASADQNTYPGARALTDGAPAPTGVALVPPLENFESLFPPTQPDGCQIGFDSAELILHRNYNNSDEPCAYGDTAADKTLYLIGGSHSEHYMPALDAVGKRRHIKIIPLLKMGCPVNSTVPLWTGEPYPSCREWSQKVTSYIKDNPPTEGIFMTSTRPTDIWGSGPETVPTEYVDLVKSFTEQGIHSFLVRDNPWRMWDEAAHPWGPMDVRSCVAEMMEGSRKETETGRAFPGVANRQAPTPDEIDAINQECGSSESASLLGTNPAIKAYDGLDVTNIDLTDAQCKDGWCPAIIGNVVAYRDSHHFTNLFSETLAPELERQMFADPWRRPRFSP